MKNLFFFVGAIVSFCHLGLANPPDSLRNEPDPFVICGCGNTPELASVGVYEKVRNLKRPPTSVSNPMPIVPVKDIPRWIPFDVNNCVCVQVKFDEHNDK